MTNALVAILLAAIAIPALGQDQAVQRELIRRQQQSDAFAQQLRQSQQLLKIAPGELERRREIESRQLGERQRLEQTSEQQLRDVRADTPQQLRPYERLKAAEERQPLIVPTE